jgi:hypothetical protein
MLLDPRCEEYDENVAERIMGVCNSILEYLGVSRNSVKILFFGIPRISAEINTSSHGIRKYGSKNSTEFCID